MTNILATPTPEGKPGGHPWQLLILLPAFLPLLLLLCARRPRLALWLLAGGALVSLALALGYTRQNQTAAFFLFPFRAWELLAGVLLAILAARRPGLAGRRDRSGHLPRGSFRTSVERAPPLPGANFGF